MPVLAPAEALELALLPWLGVLLSDALTAEGLALRADDELGLDDGVGVGVGVDVGGLPEGELETGGALLGGAELGGGSGDPPCRVTTAPPGENVNVLVHCPVGAALVAVAVIDRDCPAASVPEF